MSTKDFKQGMVAGAKPFGDKLDQLASSLDGVAEDLSGYVEESNNVKAIVNTVLDDLSAQEKKRIYDLDESMDITILENDEKEFLVAILAELANTIPEVTELQRHYIMSLCGIVGIAAPQTSLNLACIENIENMRTQKILLRHIVEFFFIGTQNYEFLEQYENIVFCYFGVNKRGVNEIITSVNRIYNAIGVEGLANRYTFVAGYEEISECDVEGSDTVDFALEEDSVDHVDYEDLILSDIIHIDDNDSIVYRCKNISMNSIISVDGSILFENCVVSFNYNDTCALLNVKGNLSFVNCQINNSFSDFEYNDKKSASGKALINGASTSTINFENCIIQNIGHFISSEGKLTIDSCSIFDPGIRFVTIQSEKESLLYNSTIEFSQRNELPPPSSDYIAREIICAFNVEDSENSAILVIENCRFANAEGDTLVNVTPISMLGTSSVVRNCEFYNFAKVQGLLSSNSVINSVFDNCRGILSPSIVSCSIKHSTHIGIQDNSTIENCDFDDCQYIVLPSKSQLKNCRIMNSNGRIINANSSEITDCIFYNVKKSNNGVPTEIIWDKGNQQNYSIYLQNTQMLNCIFDGVDLKDNAFLIVAEKLSKSKLPVSIKSCLFRNCYTDRSDKQIITCREHYGVISSKIRSIEVTDDCIGLDQVKNGTLEASVPVIDSPNKSGVVTGAVIGSALGSVLGGIGSSVGGAIGAYIGKKRANKK